MSGAQIGSTVGAVVGSFFGPVGQAIGAAVGGYIGGVIDPTEIFGPRLSDAITQTARDGVPRAYGYGTFPCAGNLIWCSDLRERKKTEGGKGSTTETTTYTYFRSYAIAVCEGPADGSGIAGYRIIKRNGKVVYDTRTDAELTSLGYSANEISETRAAQAKFTENARFYYGISDQEPDPTIQAEKGVDDVPGYSYTAYMVVTDDDVTELRGAVPQYEFVVSVCGTRTDDQGGTGQVLVTGEAIGGTGPVFAIADDAAIPVFSGIPISTGANLSPASVACANGYWLAAGVESIRVAGVGEDDNWESNSTPWESEVKSVMGSASGWLLLNTEFEGEGYLGTTTATPGDVSAYQIMVGSTPYETAAMIKHTRGFYYADLPGSASGTLLRAGTLDGPWEIVCTPSTSIPGIDTLHAIRSFIDIEAFGGDLYATVYRGPADPRLEIRKSSDEGATWTDVIVSNGSLPYPMQLQIVNGYLIALNWGNSSCYTSADGFAEEHFTGIEMDRESRIFIETFGRQIASSSTRGYIIAGTNTLTPSLGNKLVTTEDGITFSDPIDLPITNLRSIACSGAEIPIGATPIPDSPGYWVDQDTGEIGGPGGTTISECAPTLAEIVEDQCALRGVTTVDVSPLEDDDVLGFRIANTSSPQKNILAAQPGYFFDSSEFDGVLHFPKRGGADSFHIPFDEMVMRDGEAIQWERTQEAELLRKVTFTYFDPRATYTATSQTGERRAGTIQAMGESSSQLPLVGTGDWAAQAADINLKSAWYEPDECTFPVSLDWAELVPAAVGTIEDERGTLHRIRIIDIKDDGLIRLVKGRRTDAAAYQSNASGKPIPLPTFPGSDIRGPTTSTVLNMPAVLDSHDRPGLYWAATGTFASWIGAVLQVQRAGQWVTLAQTVAGATVGTLVEDLPYHGGDIDNVNTFSVRINTTLESVTFTQLLNERNPFAIAYPDGTAEIIQFQDAELDSNGVWNCTRLLRGRLNTVEGLHFAGATVVAIDSLIQFVDLRSDDLGKTLLFRVISTGTNPDAVTPFSVTFDRIWSSTEWEVAELEVSRDGDDFTVSWIPRHRLGTDVNPIRSGNWDGFLVRYQYADQFFEEVITSTSKTYNLPGASDVEFTVFQLNRLTGAGPGVSVTHE